MENNTNPQFHFETIKDEPHLVLTFSDREWLEENLWISERDLCCAEMLDAIPHDLRIEINYPKFIKALSIVKEYRETLNEVQIDCGISSQHFDDKSTNKTLFNERLQIPRPGLAKSDIGVVYEFYVKFSEYDTDFDYELSLNWSMFGIKEYDSFNDLLEQLCDKALEAGVITSFESHRRVLCL